MASKRSRRRESARRYAAIRSAFRAVDKMRLTELEQCRNAYAAELARRGVDDLDPEVFEIHSHLLSAGQPMTGIGPIAVLRRLKRVIAQVDASSLPNWLTPPPSAAPMPALLFEHSPKIVDVELTRTGREVVSQALKEETALNTDGSAAFIAWLRISRTDSSSVTVNIGPSTVGTLPPECDVESVMQKLNLDARRRSTFDFFAPAVARGSGGSDTRLSIKLH